MLSVCIKQAEKAGEEDFILVYTYRCKVVLKRRFYFYCYIGWIWDSMENSWRLFHFKKKKKGERTYIYYTYIVWSYDKGLALC